jgi:Na+-transporting NADH:ubiquinone oxidoreductase subunit NqrD
MQNQRAHPLLLIGLLSVTAATVMGRLVCLHLPTDLLEGFFDGLGVATIYGYLLARRTGRLRSL